MTKIERGKQNEIKNIEIRLIIVERKNDNKEHYGDGKGKHNSLN